MHFQDITTLLGAEAEELLSHTCAKIPADSIHKTSAKHVNQVFSQSDRPKAVIQSLHRMYNTGRLAHTGYLSIFPVDQGVEHTAGYSFAANPSYFSPTRIVETAIEGGCNAVASTLGVLGLVSKKYAHKIPFIVKLNHNERLSLPANNDQTLYAMVQQAADMGAAAVGATIYFGSPESNRQIQEISECFALAHSLGMATILWCYPRSDSYTKDGTNYETSADITAQAIYLGVTIEADIIKQKFPTNFGAFKKLKFSKYSDEMYDKLLTDNPIDMVRYQVAHCFGGAIGMINSGGESSGESDLAELVRTAVINKRGGGSGLIAGRKIFKRPVTEGIRLLNAVQDVYLTNEITVA